MTSIIDNGEERKFSSVKPPMQSIITSTNSSISDESPPEELPMTPEDQDLKSQQAETNLEEFLSALDTTSDTVSR